MADIFFKFAPLYEFPRPDKEHKRAIRLFQQGVYFVYPDAAVLRRFFYRQCHFKVDRHMCFGLRTCRRYGSFAVKITSEVLFFVAHSGISSCSRYTQMVISVCNLPNGRERAGTTGISPQLTICQSRPHRLRRFYHARTVTGREYHYALCGSQRNRELSGIWSRQGSIAASDSLAEKQVMAYRSTRSPQRERIWQVDIQFSRFKRNRHGGFRDAKSKRTAPRKKYPSLYTTFFGVL